MCAAIWPALGLPSSRAFHVLLLASSSRRASSEASSASALARAAVIRSSNSTRHRPVAPVAVEEPAGGTG